MTQSDTVSSKGMDENIADGKPNQLSLIQDLPEFTGSSDAKNPTSDSTFDLTELGNDLEENCIYIFDSKCVNVQSWQHSNSMFVSIENSKISSTTFESFATAVYAMLPHKLKISAEEIGYRHGIPDGHPNSPTYGHLKFPHPCHAVRVA